MNKFLFIMLVSLSALAWDSMPGNFTGKYIITQSEACARYALYYNCVESKELVGKTIEIVQSKINGVDIICIKKNFKDYLTNDGCYKNLPSENSTLSISSSGFKAEFNDIRFGQQFGTTYAKFSRSGTEYQFKDGGSVKGIHMYYNYTLEKSKN